jgi:hypothetical protein
LLRWERGGQEREHELHAFAGAGFHILTGKFTVALLPGCALMDEIGRGVMPEIRSLKLLDASEYTLGR